MVYVTRWFNLMFCFNSSRTFGLIYSVFTYILGNKLNFEMYEVNYPFPKLFLSLNYDLHLPLFKYVSFMFQTYLNISIK